MWLWFAFRGTEPSKLNDVMADLKVIKNSAVAGGKVHGGFQEEVNDLWMDIVKELEHVQSPFPRMISLSVKLTRALVFKHTRSTSIPRGEKSSTGL